ncbi:MAG: hypothetical protein ACOCQR_01710 [bacterium]
MLSEKKIKKQLKEERKVLNIQNLKVKDLNLSKPVYVSVDHVLYYDDNFSFGFEAHFDNSKFNGKISYCLQLDDVAGIDIKEKWSFLSKEENEKLYEFIKSKAIADYSKKYDFH